MRRAGHSRAGLRRAGIGAATAVLAVSAAVGCTRPLEDTSPPPTALAIVEPVLVGAAVPRSRVANLDALEGETGERLSIVRTFVRWETEFPDADHQQIIDAGYPIHLSIRPRREDGQNIAWADLATATDGDPLMAEIRAWAARIALLPPGSYVTFNHEPDTTDSAPNGDAADFVAAWRNVMPIWTESGVTGAWVLTGGAFSGADEGLGVAGRADEWYPGDDVVDVIGADLYNWHTCQGGERPWRPFAQLLSPPLAFAEAHGKPLVVPEFASVEDATVEGRKAEWIDGVRATLAEPEVAARVEFVAWFNVTAPGGTWPDCVWDINTSSSSVTAFGELLASDD